MTPLTGELLQADIVAGNLQSVDQTCDLGGFSRAIETLKDDEEAASHQSVGALPIFHTFSLSDMARQEREEICGNSWS